MRIQEEEWPEDDRSAAEKFLTVLAYRPATKSHDPAIMVDVAELERMRLAGEKVPTEDELIDWRRSRAQRKG